MTSEERELALIKSRPGFEARPLNKAIYSAAHKERLLNGLTQELRVKRKALETKICEFNLTQPTKRAKLSETEEKFVVKTPKKGTLGNTKIQEFALSTSKRTKKPFSVSPKKVPAFKATPKPEFSVPSPKKSTRGFDLAKSTIQKKIVQT
jgi:hypothetical protein